MMEMIICRRCGRETPAIANYCKSCRGNPRPRQDKLWSGEKLEVTYSANFGLLMEAIFNEKMEETPSANAV